MEMHYYYDITIDDEIVDDPYDSLSDAIRDAQMYAEDPYYADSIIRVQIAHFTTDENGDIDSTFADDMQVVWTSIDGRIY